ncbi:hypothetical protein GCM10010498_38290 [Streptomyces cavourensis]|nr:hypothetical protein GCM10010498_38290 [Streptomyces cavourensis]
MVPVFFTVHWPSKPLPQSDFLVYVAVAEVAADAGEARPTIAANGTARAVRPAMTFDRPLRVGIHLNLDRRWGVSVLNGAPGVRSSNGGSSWTANPAPP